MDVGQTSPLLGKILGISQSGDEFIERELLQYLHAVRRYSPVTGKSGLVASFVVL
jgi:hypothetical protein